MNNYARRALLIYTKMLTLKWLGHFFQNVISFSDAVHLMCNIFYMKLVLYNESLVSIVATDALVLKHQGINSHSADYAPMRFPVFKG